MTRARLVTWQEYLANKSVRSGLASVGCVVGVIGAFGLIAAGVSVLLVVWMIASGRTYDWFAVSLVAACIFGLLCCGMVWAGRALLEAADSVPEVALITRASVGRLPPQESLVRGADRPMDGEADRLLRAAASAGATSAPELLRATNMTGGTDALDTEAGERRSVEFDT